MASTADFRSVNGFGFDSPMGYKWRNSSVDLEHSLHKAEVVGLIPIYATTNIAD